MVFLTMVPVTGMIALGLGYALYGGSALLHGDGDMRDFAILVLVPIVVAGIRGRLRAYAEAATPIDQPPKLPPPVASPPIHKVA